MTCSLVNQTAFRERACARERGRGGRRIRSGSRDYYQSCKTQAKGNVKTQWTLLFSKNGNEVGLRQSRHCRQDVSATDRREAGCCWLLLVAALQIIDGFISLYQRSFRKSHLFFLLCDLILRKYS